jgi:hypothetical protein
MPQIVGGFAGLNLLQDVVNSGFRQRLVPKSGVRILISNFNYEIADLRHSDSWQGY